MIGGFVSVRVGGFTIESSETEVRDPVLIFEKDADPETETDAAHARIELCSEELEELGAACTAWLKLQGHNL